jgi:hypothetical protein
MSGQQQVKEHKKENDLAGNSEFLDQAMNMDSVLRQQIPPAAERADISDAVLFPVSVQPFLFLIHDNAATE